MKNILLIFSFLFISMNIQAQDQKQVLDEFKIIVNKFNEFFKEPQKMIYKDINSLNTAGVQVEIYKCTATNISYDVKKTESIVSPYTAIIKIDFNTISNEFCGNLFSGKNKKKMCIGFDSEKSAMENDKEDCFKSQFIDNYNWGQNSYKIDFNFAYQDDKWTFKQVPMYPIFEYAFGFSNNPKLTEKKAIELNDKWIELVK